MQVLPRYGLCRRFGASMRKDFTVVGNIINLAARLMMKAADREPFSFIADNRTAPKAR